ncbi:MULTISPECIES: hypothetical protein [Methanothermobacter]|jgi:hypothetical protein|uniref:Uncharacterized protein n=1 Tax=Methanothermobacter thermautotrophicus TaxID=145262 RepID=A0A7J4MV54_METTF|nr:MULTISPECIES: hypothetical protein [Methanothermobacter]MDK2874167.1 hypothetical protein [Methanothermobacter sp.]MDN5373359.1 hypothetical protein [Methanothermobacter sp.]NLU03478.1 hypothetical protein [Methanothermobacter sp.]WBF07811.1 hypothetical protein ISG36_07320 [Methanothermobacter thermautotrophicus]BAM70629.1 conserved hypothetical protein [Methanothermobacter sp. CaT2]
MDSGILIYQGQEYGRDQDEKNKKERRRSAEEWVILKRQIYRLAVEAGWPLEYILEMPYSSFTECLLSFQDPPRQGPAVRDVEAELDRLKELNYKSVRLRT